MTGCASEQTATPLGSASTQSTFVGTQFPEFELVKYDTDEVVSTRVITPGKIVNLWASWCEPCKREFPLMASSEYSGDIIAININDLSESQAGKTQADELVALGGNSLSVWVDSQNIVKSQLSVTGLPMTFAVNSEGVIVDVEIGELKEASLNRLAKAVAQ